MINWVWASGKRRGSLLLQSFLPLASSSQLTLSQPCLLLPAVYLNASLNIVNPCPHWKQLHQVIFSVWAHSLTHAICFQHLVSPLTAFKKVISDIHNTVRFCGRRLYLLKQRLSGLIHFLRKAYIH